MGFRDIVTARICSVCHFTTRVYGILSILSGISYYIKRKRIQSEVLRWPSGGFRGGSGGSNECVTSYDILPWSTVHMMQ